jgi:protein-serine/threonine kinase
MKRSRLVQDSTPVEYTLCEEHFGAPLEPQLSRNGLIIPPPEDSQRPSKIRCSGSNLMSVLRSLTNSGMYQYSWSSSTSAITWNMLITTNEASNPSYEEVSPPMPLSSGVSKKISLPFLRKPVPPTLVHRSQLKARLSLISVDRSVGLVDILPDASPSTSAETSVNSGKSSAPETRNHSTRKTSQDSKFSQLAKKFSGQSQHSSENKKTVLKQVAAEGSVETPLKPILEVEVVETAPEPIPSRFYRITNSLRWEENL